MTSHAPALLERLQETCAVVRARTPLAPRLGLVLGSGLGAFADSLDDRVAIPFGDLPHLAPSRVVGHAGAFVLGTWKGVPVACMQGRIHLYEGHDENTVVHGVRTMAALGVKGVLLTNAAGGLDSSWAPGDLMVIRDQLNLTARTPLLGLNDDRVGPRFPDMTESYDRALGDTLVRLGAAQGLPMREGVYAGLLGPSYETPAEIRMLHGFGARAVGMSTVLETIALRHMGVPVAGLSCITNLAAGISPVPLDHSEVEAVARARRAELVKLVGAFIESAGSAA
jgi:purine-nucleoside phosphorylase